MSYLTKEQVYELNELHGWFEYADAQGDASRSFAQDAIAMHEAMRKAAPDLLFALEYLLIQVENVGGEHVTGLGQLYEGARIGYDAVRKAKEWKCR